MSGGAPSPPTAVPAPAPTAGAAAAGSRQPSPPLPPILPPPAANDDTHAIDMEFLASAVGVSPRAVQGLLHEQTEQHHPQPSRNHGPHPTPSHRASPEPDFEHDEVSIRRIDTLVRHAAVPLPEEELDFPDDEPREDPNHPLQAFPLLPIPRPPEHDGTEQSRWRRMTHNFLESRQVHVAILALVLLDVAVTLSEIFVELFAYQQCRDHSPSPIKFEPSHGVEEATHVLHWMTVSILSVFMLETFLKVLVLEWSYYTKHLIHTLDAIVIVTSFFVTIFLHGPLGEIVSLFIFLRLWRVFRIIDGVALTLEEEHAKKKNKMIRHTEKLKAEIARLKDALAAAEGTGGHAAAGTNYDKYMLNGGSGGNGQQQGHENEKENGAGGNGETGGWRDEERGETHVQQVNKKEQHRE